MTDLFEQEVSSARKAINEHLLQGIVEGEIVRTLLSSGYSVASLLVALRSMKYNVKIRHHDAACEDDMCRKDDLIVVRTASNLAYFSNKQPGKKSVLDVSTKKPSEPRTLSRQGGEKIKTAR